MGASMLALAGTRIIPRLLSLAVVIYSARLLGPEGYGRYQTALGFVALFGFLGDLGLGTFLATEGARTPERGPTWLGSVIPLRLVLGAASLVLIPLLARAYTPDRSMHLGIEIATAALVLSSLIAAFDAFFQSRERMGYLLASSAVYSTLFLLAGLGALWVGWGWIGLLGAMCAAGGATLLLQWSLYRRRVGALPVVLRWGAHWRALREAAYFTVAWALLAVYSRLDLVILSALSGPHAAGVYAAAYKFLDLLQNLPAIVTFAFLPGLARGGQGGSESVPFLTGRMLKYLVGAAAPLALGGLILAPDLVRVLYGPSYAPSTACLRLLLIALFFYFLNAGFNTLLIARCGAREFALLMGGIVLLSGGATWWFVSPRGMGWAERGAATGMVLTEAALAAGYCVVLGRKSLLFLPWQDLLRGLVCAGAMGGILVGPLAGVPLAVRVVGGAAAYLLAWVAVGGVDGWDRRLLRDAVRPMPRGAGGLSPLGVGGDR